MIKMERGTWRIINVTNWVFPNKEKHSSKSIVWKTLEGWGCDSTLNVKHYEKHNVEAKIDTEWNNVFNTST